MSGPYEIWCLPVGAAISRPSLLPRREKVPSVCEADEGDLLARIIYGGSPKGPLRRDGTMRVGADVLIGPLLGKLQEAPTS